MIHLMRTLVTICFALMVCTMNINAHGPFPDESKRRELKRGEILITIDKHPITNAFLPTGQCLVEASVEDVWWIITDFDSFKEFLPHVVYYRPLFWKDDRLLVDCKVKLAFINYKYRLSYIIDESEHSTYWFYESGPIHDTQGYWRVEPFDGKHTLVTYTTTIDVGSAVPDFIEKKMAKSTFPEIFHSLRSRVKELKIQGSLKRPQLPAKGTPPGGM